MKRKILLLIALIVMACCVFAISISAQENYGAEYTLSNKTALIQYNTFNYTNGENQVITNASNRDEVTITFLDENGNTITSVPMWEYDEEDGKYYGLVWYIKDYELTYVMADQYVWAQVNGKWANQYDTEGDQRRKYTAVTYTLAKARAVDLTYEFSTDKKTYSYTNEKHENCTWTWSKNGQSFTALKQIYLDAEKTVKLQAPVGVGQQNKPNGYEGYEAQFEATGNKIVVANLKDLNFQTHYTDSSNKSLWTLATNLQCLWYPDTVVHLASGVGINIREIQFEGLEVIGCQMFRENKFITEVRVPNKCEYVCDEAFRETNIKTIRYGENIKIVANAVLSGITPTTYYLTTNFISDSYLTGYTKTSVWGYGYIINSNKATVYFAGTQSEAEEFWARLAADNESYTEVHFYDYDSVKERETATGMAIFYNYNKCDALYMGNHIEKTVDNNACFIADCTRCDIENLYVGNESTHIYSTAITYVSYDKSGVRAITCNNKGCTYCVEDEVKPLFTCNGYSIPENNRIALSVSYAINKDAVAEYKSVNGDFEYGVFAVAETKIGTNELFKEDGSLTTNSVCANLTSDSALTSVSLRILGFTTDELKALGLAMGLYVKEVNEGKTVYSYLQAHTPESGQKYSFISYNQVLEQ